MALRVNRSTLPTVSTVSVSTGRIRWISRACRVSPPTLVTPLAGSQPSWTENSRIRSSPSQNDGIEMPANANRLRP